ncbi:lysosome membrane protein 2-like [Mizuhopecten yessoensis]|uniref:lysosome membrane protein 2-like n=1 Tax=Mizuhopecten yessoensis TaxID=6573 RepID=UPI000B45DD9F|nr:lysosome membrane protein 2-like [Mizuhopecten yessoensis]
MHVILKSRHVTLKTLRRVSVVEEFRAQAIAELLRFEYDWLQELVDALLEAVDDAELFLELSIADILWGYEDNLLKSIKDIAERFNHTLPDQFGLFYNTNGSDDGVYTIFTGSDVQGVDKFNIIDKWNSKTSLGYWNTTLCDMINGTDGTMFPPFVEKSDRLYIFSTDICRSIYASFEKDVSLKGVDLYRFSVPPRVFERASLNENNAGFCSGNCLPSGVLNISVCKSGAPVVISNPHFLQADTEVIEGVIGMHPNKKEHETVLDVDPLTGLVFNAQKKLQLNAHLQKVNHIRSTANIKEVFFPIMWLNESALIDDKSANEYKSGLLTPIRITQAVQYGLIVVGAFLFICALAFLIKHRMSHKKTEVLVDIPNERLTNDRPPTEKTVLIQQ